MPQATDVRAVRARWVGRLNLYSVSLLLGLTVPALALALVWLVHGWAAGAGAIPGEAHGVTPWASGVIPGVGAQVISNPMLRVCV